MAEVRAELPPVPKRLRKMPVEKRGYPVPWFVAWLDEDRNLLPAGEGTPDFRVIKPGAIAEAHNRKRCWMCGETLGAYVAFTIGPMCAINRICSEPPSHRDCAEFAARACPFLVRPHAKRRPVPGADFSEVAGDAITHNPGAALVWVTKHNRYSVRKDPDGKPLFNVGKPTEVMWICEGRDATRAEVLGSFEKGLPHLVDAAKAEGKHAEGALKLALERALPLVPAA